MPGKKIPIERAAAVVEACEVQGWSQRQAQDAFGVHFRSVSDILARHGRWGEVTEGPVFARLRQEQKRHFQVASFELAKKALIQAESSVGKASFLQAVTGYAILRDKEHIDAGEPNQISATLNLTASVSLDKLAEMLGQKLVESNTVSPDRTPETPIKTGK